MKYGRKLSPFRLGVIPSQWSAHLPKKIDVLRASSFSARVSLSINTSAALYDQVCRNEVDAIVIERPNVGLSSKLQTFMLRREALVLLHNESEKKNANEILTQRNFIEYLPDAICHNYAAKYLADHGLNPDPVCDTTSLATIKALVSDGVGVSLVPKWPGLEGNLDGLQTLEIVDASYSREIVLITTASEDQKPLVERLIDIFRDVNKVDHHDFVI